jgi:hypothetical protein
MASLYPQCFFIMAVVTQFSLLKPDPAKGFINSVVNLDTQFNTGPAAVTTLTASADSIVTTLDAPIGAPIGYQSIGFNILNNQTLSTAAGNDLLKVTQGLAVNAVGIKIGTGGLLDLGLGDDKVAVALTGAGSVGVNNQGKFLTGDGGDTLAFDAILNGFVNGSATNTTAVVDTGAGGDKLSATSETGPAIMNYGTLTMGLTTENDKDVLTGGSAGHLGLTPAYTPTRVGIFNAGTINMGGGKDVIDALVGGFGGNGTYNLGWTVKNAAGVITSQDADADQVNGFGSGTFNGGGGLNGITLPDGTYKITYTVKPLGLAGLASGTVTRNGVLTTVMTFNQFSTIGGSGLTAALDFASVPPVGAVQVLSSFTVNAAGNITAATYI